MNTIILMATILATLGDSVYGRRPTSKRQHEKQATIESISRTVNSAGEMENVLDYNRNKAVSLVMLTAAMLGAQNTINTNKLHEKQVNILLRQAILMSARNFNKTRFCEQAKKAWFLFLFKCDEFMG